MCCSGQFYLLRHKCCAFITALKTFRDGGGIFKLRCPEIDSKKSIPPAYVPEARRYDNSILAFTDCYTIAAQYSIYRILMLIFLLLG
jgi:hypothetical protein